MRIIAADDEKLALEMLTSAIREVLPEAEIQAFSRARDVLDYAKEHPCETAFLDIQMRSMDGIELAKKLKDLLPRLNIIFVTGYDRYTREAMALHASGYIEKPVTPEKLQQELDDLRYPVEEPQDRGLLRICCFGNFDVYAPDGALIRFERSKAKECLAYLVSRCGTACSVREIAAALFEDEPYDRKQANYLQKIIASMVKTLREAGAADAIQKNHNALAIDLQKVDCDYYRFRQGDVQAINHYHGVFLAQYSWAEFIAAYLDNAVQPENKW